MITKEGISASNKKIEAISKISPPKNITQLRLFLGIVNHYRKFVPLLAQLSDLLNQPLKKHTSWVWLPDCQKRFIELKEALTSAAVLTHLDPKLPIALTCDASSIGIGAVIYHIAIPRRDRKANSVCIKNIVECRVEVLSD